MLEKAVAAVKADKTKAHSIFWNRDLYPFSFNISDGKIVAVGKPNTTMGLHGWTVGPLRAPLKENASDLPAETLFFARPCAKATMTAITKKRPHRGPLKSD